MEELITVTNVQKKYCRTLKHALWYGLNDIFSELTYRRNKTELRKNEFWALEDLSFSVKRGESIGLIGSNGSGKSTLLKLISGLMKPDHGSITVRGKLGALIELGAGFNPILTGRENIYINAAILGIEKKKIDKDIDEIIDFSGLEDAIETPVQFYSSGMKVRLGFAVASQLSPDILLIDEVLSVGDLSFRTKCMNRLNEMKRNGVSIILVSHQLTHITQFADRAIWLDKGKMKLDSNSLETCKNYVSSENKKDTAVMYGGEFINKSKIESANFILKSDKSNENNTCLYYGDYFNIEYEFNIICSPTLPNISFPIYRDDGLLVTALASNSRDINIMDEDGAFRGIVKAGPILFNPGRYIMIANFHDGVEYIFRSVVAEFNIDINSNILTHGIVDLEQEWL